MIVTGYPAPRERQSTPPQPSPLYLESTQQGERHSGAVQSPASPGNLGHVQAFNPDGSGKGVLIESLLIQTTVDMRVTLYRGQTALPNFAGVWRSLGDLRIPGVVELRHEQSAGTAGDVLATLAVRAFDSIVPIPIGVWLIPGHAIWAQATVVNVLFGATFQGRERPRRVF